MFKRLLNKISQFFEHKTLALAQWHIQRHIEKALAQERTRLLEIWRKIMPPYNQRTPQEHDEIRRKIQQEPAECDHLKGGPSFFKDYAVLKHTFIDGTERIRCMLCGRKWFKEDSDWADAQRMVAQSTNHSSSSEVPNEILYKIRG